MVSMLNGSKSSQVAVVERSGDAAREPDRERFDYTDVEGEERSLARRRMMRLTLPLSVMAKLQLESKHSSFNSPNMHCPCRSTTS